jgi:hypothetical protein
MILHFYFFKDYLRKNRILYVQLALNVNISFIHREIVNYLFMMLYRGNTNECFQYLNEKEYIYWAKNDAFRENKTNYWIFH